ncbi:16S rRNA (cytosine(1402)-N(4))-methyltransferase RsmH [Pleionea sp. CnH1-48]|uniref:16S rRNA (cytosine(1402)-N(4))-methyltransferase RsmH n=1 Tax=Pleionea sp. CnH1-48 TaxID=2954494 RepID=UPI0020976E04|nr:16S rRNA (cytosine(1402)-N(4))-methyltransferase RsmH [Pleionea sp. CnH1-48]MCO7224000.1 16S rRNA (cytosine(1402)-N(4))-methyltransferase RsmH [Pleionea sp. CnH1-48]
MNTEYQHKAVLLQEAVDALAVKPEGLYVDGTFGRGGHSQLILKQVDNQCQLIAFDKDMQAIKHAEQILGANDSFSIAHRSFAEMEEEIKQRGLDGQVDGVLLDLGVSSPQLDEAERGFSFMHDGPLDMRMDQSQGWSAAEWLARASVDEIRRVIKEYGEERFATRIARAIVEIREETPITTTAQLAKIIDEAVPKKDPGKHPATRSFQAIRIHINKELSDLEAGLDAAMSILKPGGRMVVISFHSLEDRIVKRFFKKLAKGDDFPRDFPITADEIKPKMKLLGKPQKPAGDEVDENIRSRSAIMRVAEKLW